MLGKPVGRSLPTVDDTAVPDELPKALPAFRAWVFSEQVMVDVIGIHFKDKKVLLPIETPVYDYYWHDTEWFFNEVELMQYSNIESNSGDYVCREDIVEHTYLVDQGYGNVGEETEVVVIKDMNNLPFTDATIGCYILGNTYENPELVVGNETIKKEGYEHGR